MLVECGPRQLISNYPKRKAANGFRVMRIYAYTQMPSSAAEQASTRLPLCTMAFLDRLVTESNSGRGRGLSAVLSVPAAEFDATIADLKKLGRVEGIEETGEDSAVKLENSARNLEAARTTLERLQNLQRNRKGELRDALEVEKEIAQANSAVREAVLQRDGLLSTVIQAHIHLALRENFRAPLEASFPGTLLSLRNSMVEGIGVILSSITMVSGAFLEYGLPIAFWCLVLFWPGRLAWKRFRARQPLAQQRS
jgi:hypothetical protein